MKEKAEEEVYLLSRGKYFLADVALLVPFVH
jgi:hypothetical protein